MSVGLPSWARLIEHMLRELGLERSGEDESYQTLAEYYRLTQGSIGALRSWMDRTWNVSEERVRASRIHKLIVQLDFPIIYTTNYDNNLEVAYRIHGREFVKIVNARDLARAWDGLPQIIKFHGDFEDDQSLVITESDYFDRLTFDSPLDIKFRSDTLGRTILFIGYSMSDPNIRLMLHKLWRMWRETGREKDRPPSFVLLGEPSPARDAVLEHWGISVICNEEQTPEERLSLFLERLCQDVLSADDRQALPATSSKAAANDLAARSSRGMPMEDSMADKVKTSRKPGTGSATRHEPAKGGDDARKAQEWGGGSKGSKGSVTAADKRNENSSAKS